MIPRLINKASEIGTSDLHPNMINDTSKPFVLIEDNEDSLLSIYNNFNSPLLWSQARSTTNVFVCMLICKKVSEKNKNNIIISELDTQVYKVMKEDPAPTFSLSYFPGSVTTTSKLKRAGIQDKEDHSKNSIVIDSKVVSTSDSFSKKYYPKEQIDIPANVFKNTVVRDGLYSSFMFRVISTNYPDITGLVAATDSEILFRDTESSPFYPIYNFLNGTEIVPNWKALFLKGYVAHTANTFGNVYTEEILWMQNLSRNIFIDIKRTYKNIIDGFNEYKLPTFNKMYQKYTAIEELFRTYKINECSLILESTKNYSADYHNNEKWDII